MSELKFFGVIQLTITWPNALVDFDVRLRDSNDRLLGASDAVFSVLFLTTFQEQNGPNAPMERISLPVVGGTEYFIAISL